MRAMGDTVDRLAEAAGREPGAIVHASSLSLSEPWDEVRRQAAAMRGAGVDYLVCGWPGEGRARVEEFATTVMPEIVAD
jgi:hypothetical protein